ncbi:hypothetical protein CAS74_001555 [Pichia kudriavzevii]|uniref:Protein HLJ1 n=1 Tax=Pichia kudriavzevii TaxID=4909 RepID=A0A099NZM7_PICKU|nr:uncharacterized protein C5L36_0A03490 [Pichia kudriavzevii]AWU73748.1 hypothetical protein C5L36_0A03490 [Pichia kudriavzevii]KGK37372.1 hypothetical protein JL09_g3494 [Pichia kudriavzevii]ONH76756.1 Protein HLJ1 [Pichia kudriavzevii]OUT23240.1 hypothetical protein CAS74_001555 [Pichia kudriavzevii]
MADCTPEQAKLVDEILSIQRTDYYRVLKVDKSASDVEIKKSYRKLAIKLHPDKNKHPKASEAFKVIAKAFEVLGDESKRKLYDMTGTDPDSRSAGASGGGAGHPGAHFNNFQGFGGGFPGFQGGFQPGPGMGGGLNEDLLNMLFGMGGLGNNGFSFTFGGNGFPNNGFYYSNQPGMNARRRAAQNANAQRQGQGARRGAAGREQAQWTQYIVQFLPLLIILFSIIINSLTGDSSSNYNNARQFHGRVPKYGFEKGAGLDVERTTPNHNINYYISEKTLNNFQGRKNADTELAGLDKYVEGQYINELSQTCQREKNYQRELIESAQGIFYNDWDKIERAQKMTLPHCERLRELNLL